MHLQDEVRILRQRPRHVLRFKQRQSARLPAEKMAFGDLHSFRQRHSRKSKTSIRSIHFAALASVIHVDENMMNNLWISGLKLNSSHITVAIQGDRQNEIAINILSFSRERKSLRQF